VDVVHTSLFINSV